MRIRRVSCIGNETGQVDSMTSFAHGLPGKTAGFAFDEDPADAESTDRGAA